MKEISVEDYLREQVIARGGLIEKHVAPGRRDVPDDLVTWWAQMDLVETKAPGKKPRKGQERDHWKRAQRNVHVWVLDTKEKVDAYIEFRRPAWLRQPGSVLSRTGIPWKQFHMGIFTNRDEME